MKKISLYISALALAVGAMVTACDDDLDKYSVSDLPTASTVESNVTDVVITDGNLGTPVCTLKFSATSDAFTASDGTSLGDGAYFLQYSLNESFDPFQHKEITATAGNNELSFSGMELNSFAVKLNAKYDVVTPMYFRIVHTYNSSSEVLGTTSNVVCVKVTPMEVPMISVVSKGSADVQFATLQFNGETGRFEGTYPAADEKVKAVWSTAHDDGGKAWNFYFIDTKGTVYGCDDEWTKSDDGINRNYKLVSGREIGDGYSHWFDPAVVGDGVTMWVDLNAMEWGFVGKENENTSEGENSESTVELEKDQLGIRGNGDWEKSSNATNPKIADDVYTYVIENIEIASEFKFYCNDRWIGVNDFATLGEGFSGEDNLSLEAGTYTLIVVAKYNDDGTFTYESATAIKDGLGMRGNGDWDNTANIVAPTINGNVYTYVIEDVVIASEFKFYCKGQWIGVKNITTLGEGFSGEDNLSLAPGTYKLTVVANAAEDGSLTFESANAEQTAKADKADLTNVELGIKGNGDWGSLQNAATPTKTGDVYTYVISGVAISSEFKFVYGDNWLGYSEFATIDAKFTSGAGGNLILDAGTYNFEVVLTANEDGTVTATSVTIAE
jgi:hypothetical protein